MNSIIPNSPTLSLNMPDSHTCNPDPMSISNSEQDSEHVENTTPYTNKDPSSQSNNNHISQIFEDDAMEEGDEHTRQITGGPLASMMTIENPEAFNEIVCVAPAEGQKPLYIMTDPNFEVMSNPEKFPISSVDVLPQRDPTK